MPADERSQAELTGALSAGTIEIEGRMPWSSNNTFLVTVTTGDSRVAAIYKPGRGERPLWDFPDGLYRREVAAYELSEALGWGFVPATVEVDDGPLGPGSLQAFVDADFEQHYFTLLEDEAHHPVLKRMATFDVLANNADRKGGHCLIDASGRIWGIDHGLCFHVQQKLRTVIWDFAGERVEPEDATAVQRLVQDGPPEGLARLLHPEEIRALLKRAGWLLEDGCLPEPRTDHPFPWPLV
ncbi:MAG TPA: SCO1664 family protein [Acidimicrobiales bacterium]|nr:SCO1664 family protein [Acidimicrobiales bacterium]